MGTLGFPVLTHLDDLKLDLENMERLKAGAIDQFSMEKRYFARDGRTVWVNLTVSPLWAAGEEPSQHIAIVQDITERKRTEQALQEQQSLLRDSERRFRQVVESLPQLVWTCRPDGLCDYLSPQWVAYTGVPEAAQLDYGWLERIHPDDRARNIEHWQTSTKQGENFHIEHRIRRYDGAYRWFYTEALPLKDDSGQIVKWFGANTDIDDLKRTGEALRLRTLELDQFFALSTDLLCIADMRGYFLRLGAAWEKSLGYALSELQSQPFIERVHPDDRQATLDVFANLRQGQPVIDFRNRYRSRDGDYRWLEWRSVPGGDDLIMR
jgi:PAS domain S-box-containing protein